MVLEEMAAEGVPGLCEELHQLGGRTFGGLAEDGAAVLHADDRQFRRRQRPALLKRPRDVEVA